MAPSQPDRSDAYRNPSLPFPLETSGMVTKDDLAQLAPTAAKLLDDPVALMTLGDRVFELLNKDFRYQQERYRGYGR